MTTSLRPPPAPPEVAAPPTPSPPAPERHVSLAVDAGAELTVVLLTVAATVSLGRLFVNGSFLPPLLVCLLAAHALAWGARRVGLGMVGATLLSGIGLVLVVAWVIEPQTLTAGLPLGKTWSTAHADLRKAVDLFNTVVPPAAVTRGFVLASAIAAWVCAFLADTAAFRVAATFETAIPSFTMFLFGSVLAFNRNRLPYSAFYLSAVLLFVLMLSAARREETANWLAGRRGPGSRALLARGVAVGAAAVLVAIVVGPDLPGAGSAPVFNWRNKDNGPSSRTTVSPLVDIRTRLVDQSDTPLFSVQSSAPEYWRLTALDKFDGRIWSSIGTYKPANGGLPTGVRSRATTSTVTQRYAISGLSSIWLPAAFRPSHLDGVKNVRYDAESASLLTDQQTSNGLTYRVESALPQLSPSQLAGAPATLPQSITSRYLGLPTNFPTSVSSLAAGITATAATPYAKARALQDYLRNNYTYDLRVPAGHDDNALVRFLLQTKRGYCEQFAGSFAAMARAINLPSRVAVGFTSGIQAGGTYQVLNRHAHAWPEVYLSGYGWVPFEPTPGRGAPDDQSYTGVAPMPPEAAAATTPQPQATPTTAPGHGPAPTTSPKNQPPTQTHTKRHHRPAWLVAALMAGAALVLACGAAAAAAIRRRRFVDRRRSAAATADARVLVAWEEAEEALAFAGHPRRRAETPREYATRVPGPAGVSPGPLEQLASDTAAAAYSATGVAPDVVARAEDAAGTVRAQLSGRATRMERVRWILGLPSKPARTAPAIRILEVPRRRG